MLVACPSITCLLPFWLKLGVELRDWFFFPTLTRPVYLWVCRGVVTVSVRELIEFSFEKLHGAIGFHVDTCVYGAMVSMWGPLRDPLRGGIVGCSVIPLWTYVLHNTARGSK